MGLLRGLAAGRLSVLHCTGLQLTGASTQALLLPSSPRRLYDVRTLAVGDRSTLRKVQLAGQLLHASTFQLQGSPGLCCVVRQGPGAVTLQVRARLWRCLPGWQHVQRCVSFQACLCCSSLHSSAATNARLPRHSPPPAAADPLGLQVFGLPSLTQLLEAPLPKVVEHNWCWDERFDKAPGRAMSGSRHGHVALLGRGNELAR